MLGALAVAEGRWHDALSALEALSSDEAFSTQRRSEFLVTAAEIVGRNYRDTTAAQQLYDRAKVLWPHNPGPTRRQPPRALDPPAVSALRAETARIQVKIARRSASVMSVRSSGGGITQVRT